MTRGFISEHLWLLSPRCDPRCLCLSDFVWMEERNMYGGKSRIHWALDERIPIVLMGALAKQFRDLIGDWTSPNTLAALGGIPCLSFDLKGMRVAVPRGCLEAGGCWIRPLLG